MTEQDVHDFNQRMFSTMATCLTELPIEKLAELHSMLLEKYEASEGSDDEPPFAFALTALDEAIRQKQARQAMH